MPNITSNYQREPIAIVGIGCRFPGCANSPEEFWQLLKDEVDAITEIPGTRWNIQDYFDSDSLEPGKTYSKWGGFIPDIEKFDASFFKISGRETQRIDPQHRLLLEVAWEALEDAGHAPHYLQGSDTGVFVGLMTHDYGDLQTSSEQIDASDAYVIGGSILSLAANRISNFFDFCGPSLTTDTACSSSLTAVHLACQSLWSGETPLALAGGANLLLSPHMMVVISKANLLSEDGRCKSFDASANGYVRAEGAGVVVLKRLSQAQQDGDRIYATINASVMSQDGRKLGIGAPQQSSQEKLFRRACEQANVHPNEVNYIEAHGTGTLAGDPIEANAVGNVFGQRPSDAQDCVIGSVKSNIGHLEAASGVAGLIKTALCLYYRQIPASLHFHSPNPKIDFQQFKLRVPQHLETFPPNSQGRLIAGLNSFGFGGTNVHLLLERQPETPETSNLQHPTKTYLIPISARTPISLKAFARKLLEKLQLKAAISLTVQEIAHSLSLRREHHFTRTAFVANSMDEFIQQLHDFLSHNVDDLEQAKTRAYQLQEQCLVFVCSGMTQKNCGTARQLLTQEPVFAETVQKIDAIFSTLANWSIINEITEGQDQERWNQVAVAQPITFAIQIGLAQVLMRYGIQPKAVIGHSAGEVAAAYIAGALSLREATHLVFHRSQLQQAASHSGKMLVVGLTRDQVELLLMGYQNRVVIAAINSTHAITLSGESEAIQQIAQALEQKSIFVRILPGTIAYHSPAMAAAEAQIVDCLTNLRPQPTQIPMLSTVTGKSIPGEDLNAQYWAQNIREVVNFQAGIESILQRSAADFLELSSNPTLKSSIYECAQDTGRSIHYISTLHHQLADRQALLNTLKTLYELGYPVNWQELNPSGQFWKFPLYPWQKKVYWYQASLCYKKLYFGCDNQVAKEHLIENQPIEVKKYSEALRNNNNFYINQWIEALPSNPGQNTPQNWLIVSRSGTLPHLLDEVLGQEFQQHSLWLNTQSLDGLENLLRINFNEKQGQIKFHLVYVSEDDDSYDQKLGDAVLDNSLKPCIDVINLLHEIQKHKSISLQKVYILTNLTQAVGNEHVGGLAQSAVWGLARVIANELPTSQCTCIDLNYSEGRKLMPQLIQELLADSQEQEIVLRQGKKYLNLIQSYTPVCAQEQQLQIQSDSTYLIVGGFGGFGLAIAQWLANQGCRNIALAGRNIPASVDTLPEVLAMREMGITVTPFSCDVAQSNDIKQLLTTIDISMPPLRGIIHSAMVLDDVSLANLSSEHFQRVFAPKVAGAWNLHQHTQRYRLDHFVLCSSVSAILGTPGQGNYAAANAFLDTLAHARRCSGLPALSINWGLLADVGYVIRQEKQAMFEPLERVGWIKLPCQDALQALGVAMNSSLPQLIVAPMDWDTWKTFHSEGQSFRFSQLGNKTPVSQTGETEMSTLSIEDQLLTLQTKIQQQVAKVFQIEITEVDLHQPLTDLGLDSLTSVELKTALTQHVGVNISLSSVLSGCTIVELCEQTFKQFQALSHRHSKLEVTKVPLSLLQIPDHLSQPVSTHPPQVSQCNSSTSFVCISPQNNPKLRLICFPYAGGGPSVFKNWSQKLPPNIEVYALQLPGRGQRLQEKPLCEMQSAISDMLPCIQTLLNIPAVFFGHCVGAVQMFELTHRLQELNQTLPIALIASGARSPQFYTNAQFQIDVAQYSPLSPIPGHQLPEAAFLDMLQDLNFSTSQALFDNQEIRNLLLPTVRADLELNNTYRYKITDPLKVPIMALGGRVDPYVTGEHILGWQQHTTSHFSSHFLPGNHYFIETQRSSIIQKVLDVIQGLDHILQ